MLRAGVIDDEPRSLADLARRLQASGMCKVVLQSTDPQQGLAMVRDQKPDFLLLDIEMPGLDGITLAASLPKDVVVVFVSAHSSQALAAFDVEAIDFILKPVDDQRFDRMMQRLAKRFAPPTPENDGANNLLALDTRRGRLFHPETEVLGLFAEREMSRVLLRGDRQIYCLRPLKHFEQTLRPSRFARVDRSTILNIEAVRAIRPIAGAKAEILFADSAQPLTFGRAASSRLQKVISDYAAGVLG